MIAAITGTIAASSDVGAGTPEKPPAGSAKPSRMAAPMPSTTIAPRAANFSELSAIAKPALPRTPMTLMSVSATIAAHVTPCSTCGLHSTPMSLPRCSANTIAIPPAPAGLVISM